MNKILIMMGRYLPGHKDGGPIRSMINVTEALGDVYDLHIACLDRDKGDTMPYPNILPNRWNRVGKAKVWYVEPGGFTNERILKLADGMDSIYLCSFFEDYGYRTLLLKRQGRIRIPVTIASMGVFSPGAMAQKAIKKKVFLFGCRCLGLFRDITWSVTSEMEAEEMCRVIGTNAAYVIAEDLPRSEIPGYHRTGDGRKIIFLSRISPIKNLAGAIEALCCAGISATFDIYGPCEDEQYWKKCKKKLNDVQIPWAYHGDVPADTVQNLFAQHDVFLFPTMGENYGHVIFEALSVGCIPIISDQTPWKEIAAKGGGCVLPLNDIRAFGAETKRILELPANERRKMAQAGVAIARESLNRSREQTGYRTIFDKKA